MKYFLMGMMILLPCALFAWEENFVQYLKDEGYSKTEIEVILEAEKKRRQAVADKSEREKSDNDEGEESDEETGEEDDIEEERDLTRDENKLAKDEWIKERMVEWEDVLEENEWTKSSSNSRLSQHRAFYRKYFGKSEDEVEKAEKIFLKRMAKKYVNAALRGSDIPKSCREDIYLEYQNFINLATKRRNKKINNIALDLVDELKEKRQELMGKAKSEVLKKLKEYWLEKNLPGETMNEKSSFVKNYFDILAGCTSKSEYQEKAKKLISKKKLPSKEKKIINTILKDYEPKD